MPLFCMRFQPGVSFNLSRLWLSDTLSDVRRTIRASNHSKTARVQPPPEATVDNPSLRSADVGRSALPPSPVIRPLAVAQRQLRRELALLAVNRRLLALAEDPACPLLEALRLLCTVSAALDRFFESRMAHLKAACEASSASANRELAAGGLLETLVEAARQLTVAQYRLLNEHVFPALQQQGIRFLRRTDFTPLQAQWIRHYFFREIRPVLTPIGLDPAHPFPRVPNKSLNFAVEVSGKDAFGRNAAIAIVQAPRVLPRVIRVPSDIAETDYGFVFLSSILHSQMHELFPGIEIAGCYQFRVTRNMRPLGRYADGLHSYAPFDEQPGRNGVGRAVRLEVAGNCSQQIADFLLGQFALREGDLYRVDGPVNLVRLMSVPDSIDRPDLKFAAVSKPADGPHASRSPDMV